MSWIIMALLAGSIVTGVIWGTRSQKPSRQGYSGDGLVGAEVAVELASAVAEVAIDILSDS